MKFCPPCGAHIFWMSCVRCQTQCFLQVLLVRSRDNKKFLACSHTWDTERGCIRSFILSFLDKNTLHAERIEAGFHARFPLSSPQTSSPCDLLPRTKFADLVWNRSRCCVLYSAQYSYCSIRKFNSVRESWKRAQLDRVVRFHLLHVFGKLLLWA